MVHPVADGQRQPPVVVHHHPERVLAGRLPGHRQLVRRAGLQPVQIRVCDGEPGCLTVSILVMEILDNAIMVAVPGAMDAGLDSSLFWGSLAAALLVAFLLTVPVNRLRCRRRRVGVATRASCRR